ncbi:MAG: hypothetical protein M1823_001785 [Watsoniomyces obsoletus]|nr:MAG: hypothetical protein M1823_001785 [Watsoniomyces obsoletus]
MGDYRDTARALSLPISPTQHGPAGLPNWMRSRSNSSLAESSRPYQSRNRSFKRQLMDDAEHIQKHVIRALIKLSRWQQIGLVVLLLAGAVLGVLFLIFNERIFAWVEPFADRWRGIKGGWLILWFLTFLTAFPPVVGYATCLTISGFLYGLPNGWFISASATIAGSFCSFLLCRSLLSTYVNRLVASDTRFAALALTLKHDGLKLLVMIRLCPLPYSLSNGAMATFPTVRPLMYALATAIASPKLMIHIFIGGRLGALAKHGGKMDAGTKAVNYLSIAGGIILGVVVGYTIYQRTMERARQLEAEEERDLRRNAASRDGTNAFQDDVEANGGSRNPMRDDDISLFENDHDAQVYRDDGTDEEDNVFSQGDGDDDGSYSRRIR